MNTKVRESAIRTIHAFLPYYVKQLNIVISKSKDYDGNMFFAYLRYQGEAVLKDVEFFLTLLENKEERYLPLPARMVQEKVLRLIFLTHKTEAERDEIVRKDFVRFAQRVYRYPHATEKRQAAARKYFDYFCGNLDLQLDSRPVDAFPNNYDLALVCFPTEIDAFKTFYGEYSDFIHGSVSLTIQNENFFRFSVVTVARMTVELTKLYDFHLYNGVSNELGELMEKYKSEVDQFRGGP